MRQVLNILFLSLMLMACNENKAKEESDKRVPPSFVSSDDVKEIYNLYVKGDYAAYADKMLSCDDKPADYKLQMVTLLKQHAEEQEKDDGKVTDFSVVRIESLDKGRAAEAYLSVSYDKGGTEEILLQLVFDGQDWRLR